MSRTTVVAGALVALLTISVGLAAQSAQDLYQQALVQEHASGDLKQAITLYTQAAKIAGPDRALAAQALMHVAGCQEKLGDDTAALNAYAEVVQRYPEQRAMVGMAQQRLDVLRRATRGGDAAARTPGTSVGGFPVIRAVVDTYCANCHNPRSQAAGLDLDSLSHKSISENSGVWEKVARRLLARHDPPAGVRRPDEATYRAVVAEIEKALDASYANNRPLAAAERVSELELATRLSAFLWKDVPDASLLEAVERGDLSEPAILQRQVLRMLRDPKSANLVDTFFAPWLSLDKLKGASGRPPGAQLDAELLQAMETETRLFIASQVRDDRDALELWTAEYTYVNDRLARHYGLPGVFDHQFKRVTWPNATRAGLLGQAGPLTMLSLDGRTSPTVRGVYLLTRFLGIDAPPPPANVPPLPEQPEHQAGAMRERLVAHKQNPSCASCHSRFDPLGLALENFDAAGRWRANDGGAPINGTGRFADGTSFDGPAGLRAGLQRYRDAYYSGLAQRLLAVALNRKGNAGRVYDYEMPVVRKIVHDAAANGYRWSAIFAGIAASRPFQMKSVVP